MVAVETPQHSAVGGLLDYLAARRLAPGTLVRVPLGRRMVTGVVWDADGPGQAPAQALRPIAQVLDAVPALPPGWRELVGFAARYYQRGIGELALSVLPPELRRLDAAAITRRLARSVAPSTAR